MSSAGWELLAFAREIEKANLLPARPEPEQTPLPTDELVLVLSAVPAVDLARWASVSRHWKAVVAEVVRQRFKRLADLGTKGTFTKRMTSGTTRSCSGASRRITSACRRCSSASTRTRL